MSVDLSDLIGTPFAVLNCWQLAVEVYSRHGLVLDSFGIDADAVCQISAIYAAEMASDKWQQVVSPELLCIIPMRVHPRYISHCGIYLEAGQFIHSLADVGVLISSLNDPRWKHKVEGFYRAC